MKMDMYSTYNVQPSGIHYIYANLNMETRQNKINIDVEGIKDINKIHLLLNHNETRTLKACSNTYYKKGN